MLHVKIASTDKRQCVVRNVPSMTDDCNAVVVGWAEEAAGANASAAQTRERRAIDLNIIVVKKVGTYIS